LLAQALIAHPSYSQVTLLLRRPSPLRHPKLAEHIIEFEHPHLWADLVRGDVLFSALGTTRKVAGSKDAQLRVDHDYQLWAAQAAAKNGVPHYVLVSSAGAGATSPFFYPRIKGQLEQAVMTLGFSSCSILRPSILDGDRSEQRTGEKMALGIMRQMPKWLLPAAARPTLASAVAEACVRADLAAVPGARLIEAPEISAADP
jgi:uncharacterized protein YbjT (DUF2867 family)